MHTGGLHFPVFLLNGAIGVKMAEKAIFIVHRCDVHRKVASLVPNLGIGNIHVVLRAGVQTLPLLHMLMKCAGSARLQKGRSCRDCRRRRAS